MAIVTGDRYLEHLVKFAEKQAGPLIEGTLVLKLNPVGLHYVQSRLEAFAELENLLTGAPVDYLRAYISDLGDHRALEQLRRILRLLTSLKVVSVLPLPARDPTPLSLLPFGRLKVLELRGCDLSTSAARGLLELKHTLEKIICHNSTDALRHLFASRIAEIKDSPHWNRLQFVSCACNGLVVMDESLQLISAVETLDLSRNRFTKVDNLRKCSKLKHLDLGFNHFTTIASLSEVSCHIVRLVLRNNALTTLRGIENLKSLEGLDLSYNIISNFSEIEILAGLPCLRNLWLEGNPLCCARWYRSQVFSLFTHPDTLILDEKEISTREFLKRQIIIASRQKRPASFGFYYPAKDDADGVGSGNMKRKKFSRLACIAGEEQSMCSDQESVSCDNEIHSREEDVISNDEAEVVDLMNRVELMKKERSVLWLREFKEWMDITSENMGESSTYSGAVLGPDKNNYLEKKTKQMHLGESSRYVSDSFQASGDESSTNILESDNSFADTSMNLHTHQYFDRLGEAASKFSMYDKCGDSAPFMGSMDSRQNEGINHMSLKDKISHPDTVTSQRGHRSITDASGTSVTAIDGKMESHLSSASPGSPPHYQEDLLHRRHNLVEEILQLSAGSFAAISSDSNTSCSEDDNYEFCSSVADCDQLLDGELSNMLADGNSSKTLVEDKNCDPGYEVSWGDYWAKKFQKKQKRRVVSLLEPEDKNIIDKADIPEELNGNQDICKDDLEEQLGKSTTDESDVKELKDKKQGWTYKITSSLLDDADRVLYGAEQSILVSDDFVHNYFNSNVADFRVNETCRKYFRCDCIFEQESRCREVAVLLSSENILYLLHIDVTFDGSGTILRLMGRHRAEDIGEVLVGLGLQVVRVSIERDVSYLFMTRSIEKSRQLLYALQVAHSYGANHKCPLRSLEQVQVDLFDKLICRGSKMSIFQYSMVLFLRDNSEEESWVLRSLFVIGGHLLVCIEDLMLLRSLSEDASSSSYISLDSCCSIADISEMVIEVRESQSVTLALECPTSEFHPSDEKAHNTKEEVETASICLKWKLKWFSDESLLKFAALLKALHAGATMSPLLVRCIP